MQSNHYDISKRKQQISHIVQLQYTYCQIMKYCYNIIELDTHQQTLYQDQPLSLYYCSQKVKQIFRAQTKKLYKHAFAMFNENLQLRRSCKQKVMKMNKKYLINKLNK